MKLLICLITHDRKEYTQRTLKNLWENTSDGADYYLIASDNASTDDTPRYLQELHRRGRLNGLLLNDANYYPGKACNLGWAKGLEDYPDATHLMRLDNDMQLEKNWDLRVADYFKAIPELGQLGIDHEAIEHPQAPLHKRIINGFAVNGWPGCVGGPCIIQRKLYDAGIRWPELRWDDERNSAAQEDSAMSWEIRQRGYLTVHSHEELGRTFANKTNWHEYKDYYLKTMRDRNYEDDVKYLEGLK